MFVIAGGNFSAGSRYNFFDDGKPQTVAALRGRPRPVRPVKRLEKVGQIFVRNALSAVRKGEECLLVRTAQFDLQPPLRTFFIFELIVGNIREQPRKIGG